MPNNSGEYNSKIFELLGVLNKKELKQLELWLSTPIHNTSEEVLKLYQGLKKHYGKFDQPINKRTLMKYLDALQAEESTHPKYEAVLRQTISKLSEQIRRFLVWQHLNEDKLLEKRFLMDALARKKLYHHIPGVMGKSKKELIKSPYRTLNYYEYMLHITELEFGLEVVLNNRNAHEKMQDVIDVLRQTALSKILKYYCAAKNIEQIRKVKYHYPFMEHVEAHIHSSSDKDIPIIKTYFTLLKLIDEQQPEYYHELKSYLFENIHLFDLNEIRQFFNHMTNYGNWQIEEGNSCFFKENHDIHQKGLELGCWTAGIYFSAQQFIRFIVNALATNETDWSNDFMDTYGQQLHPDLKDDTLHYSHALIAFHNQQYNAAHDFLHNINKPEDFIEHLKLKVLLIKIYYELKQEDLYTSDSLLIDYELDTIRKHVDSARNKKMSESMRLAYHNFVNALKSILNRKRKVLEGKMIPQKNLRALKAKISGTRPLIERGWLEEKVRELVGNSSPLS